jgi:hypothetical protein
MNQLRAVTNEGIKTDYFMGERYDMDYVYYIDGKNWHGAEMYYEYPCVYTSVLITDLLGLATAGDADLLVKPHINGYGSVENRIPRYDVKYTYDAEGFVLKNLSGKKRSFKVDLSALYAGNTHYKLVDKSKSEIVAAGSTIELLPQEEASWIPIK